MLAQPSIVPERRGLSIGSVGCRVCGRVCGRAVVPEGEGWRLPVCFCCRTVAGQLHLPLVPLVALTEFRVGDATHRRLRAYKDAPVAEARERYRAELVAELARRWDDPSTGLGGWTVVTTVPSSTRPGGAPAERLVEGVPQLAERHLRLLVRGRGSGGHLQAGRDVFTPDVGVDRAGLADLSVLVFDDTTTTGAAVQSAAATLRLSGARVVGALVMGRALAPIAGTPGPAGR